MKMPRQTYDDDPTPSLTSLMPKRIAALVMAGVLVVGGLYAAPKLIENIDANELTVIQSPWSGELKWYTQPGPVWQGMGEVTSYPRRQTYDFTGDRNGIEVRFNDGGHAKMYGSIQYELPSDPKLLTEIHLKYHDPAKLQKELVETVTNASVYLVGTLMSSKESYAEKRNDLIHYITDQIQNGIYRTRQKTEWVKDPVTNVDKQVIAAEIIMDKEGNPLRQEQSAIGKFQIKVFNFTIKRIPYDETVEKQIQQQQVIAMDIQTSAAELKKAEQRALTVEQQGRANATEAKWKQEVEKATATTRAEQEALVAKTNADRDATVAKIAADREKVVAETQAAQRLQVAELDKKSAEQTKQTNILLGEGEAARKKLVLEADGALQQKLETIVRIAEVNATALKEYRGNIVPNTMIGSGGSAAAVGVGNGANAVNDFLNLQIMKSVKDLNLDMSIPATPARR